MPRKEHVGPLLSPYFTCPLPSPPPLHATSLILYWSGQWWLNCLVCAANQTIEPPLPTSIQVITSSRGISILWLCLIPLKGMSLWLFVLLFLISVGCWKQRYSHSSLVRRHASAEVHHVLVNISPPNYRFSALNDAVALEFITNS